MNHSFIINQLGENRGDYQNAVTPPIFQTSNFAYPTVAALKTALDDEIHVPLYTRGNNPTVSILRKKIAALEGADDAIIAGSGMAAISTAVIGSLKTGDHVVCVKNPYTWTDRLLNQLLSRFGISVSMIDGTHTENFEKAMKPATRLFYLESPNSLNFDLQDIAAIVAIARRNNIMTIMDNSYASPINQQPLKMGIDMVVHSASKYLSGHSDVVAGVICGAKERIEPLFAGDFLTLGGIISPNDAWLMLRGLRTLPLRMNHIAETTMKTVNFLDNHPKVEQVIYPFLPSHPQYDLAKRQMRQGSGQFSILLKTKDTQKLEAFCNRLQYFLMAVSWGGFESLIFPVFIKNNSEYPVNLVRFYIGLEDADTLIADLEQALAII